MSHLLRDDGTEEGEFEELEGDDEEGDGLEVEEEGDSGFGDGVTTTAAMVEVEPVLQNDGAADVLVGGEKEKEQEQVDVISTEAAAPIAPTTTTTTTTAHDIKINLEPSSQSQSALQQKQEPAISSENLQQSTKETVAVVMDETKTKLTNHRNGASFMAACLVAAAAIVLIWGRK